MTKDERRAYNAMKQREYRRKRGLKREPYLTTDQIFGSEGHCSDCGMRMDSEFHLRFPCKQRKFYWEED